MSLTFGSGPLSSSPRRGRLNFALADVARAYAPLEDFRQGRLDPSATRTRCPYKGEASYLSLCAPEVADLVWTYGDPQPEAAFLRGYGAADPSKVDEWLVEDDRVMAELRDPFHRVDAHASSRLAVATVDGEEVARAERPMIVFETGVVPRVYFARADLARSALVRRGSGKRTVCQYKGEATYWSVAGVEDVAWSYDSPLPDALRVQGHLSFDAKHPAVEVSLAGAEP